MLKMRHLLAATFCGLSLLLQPACAFVLQPTARPQPGNTVVTAAAHHPDGRDPEPGTVDAREARIRSPLAAVLTSSSAAAWLTAAAPQPANAGVGTVVPFEETRRSKFRGSIANSVVILRLRSSLRKRGYFAGKAMVACAKPEDELSYRLAAEFGEGGAPVALSSSAESVKAYAGGLAGKKALVVFGKDVSISREGEVGETTGSDPRGTEEALTTALKAAGVTDAVLMGGTIIHRSKDGGKDAGEDCFLPSSIVLWKDGVATDLFAEVFGDLETPRQSVVLR